MTERFAISRLSTGIPGLDALLGGGVPEYSFNVIAGSPGTGKTTLAHQIMFSLAGPARRALFFTVLGESSIKMLRYQQQYSFFDVDKIDDSIRFVNLGEEVADGDFEAVLGRIVREVESFAPDLVFVDSFKSVVLAARARSDGTPALQQFVQRLGVHLASWQATTFLIGEYMSIDSEADPIFTIADGILWLAQNLHRSSMVRKIQVTKMRGQATVAGLHTFRISSDGVQVFPRLLNVGGSRDENVRQVQQTQVERLSMGIVELDEMLGGGLPKGYSLLVSGPSGSGKSVLATSFLAEGARHGEKGVVSSFETSPGTSRNPQLDALVTAGSVAILDTRALDLSIDETLYALTDLIHRSGATRVVIDSLSGFELALSSSFREDFRESLHRMVASLTSQGATILMVSELEDRYTDLRFSPYGAAFLTDAIIMQRYVELDGHLRRMMTVVKVRNCSHSHALRLYDITNDGIVVGVPTPGLGGLLTGRP